MQGEKIGPIEYNGKEVRTVAESLILGCFGLPVGFFIAVSYGFFKKGVYENPLGWLVAYTPLFGTMFAFWWLTTIISSLILWRTKHRINSWRNLGRALFPTLIIPGSWLYLSLLFAFIFDPLNDFLLRYYSPVSTFWIVALVFFPFMDLFVYMVIPSLRVRIRSQLRLALTQRFWKEAWRNRKNRLWIIIYVAFFVYLIVEFLWKILYS